MTKTKGIYKGYKGKLLYFHPDVIKKIQAQADKKGLDWAPYVQNLIIAKAGIKKD